MTEQASYPDQSERPLPGQPSAADLDAAARSHQRLLWTYLRMLGCASDEADDLVQETLLVLVRKDAMPEPLRPFLLRTAKNLFLGARRRRNREPISNEWVDRVDAAWEHQAQREGDTWLDALAECRAQLNDRQRHALRLYYGNRLDLTAAAHHLAMRPAGLKTMLQRIRARLRACVQRRLS